jgi:hypothetical protein
VHIPFPRQPSLPFHIVATTAPRREIGTRRTLVAAHLDVPMVKPAPLMFAPLILALFVLFLLVNSP